VLKTVKNFLLDFLYPALCIGCGQYLEKAETKVCYRCLTAPPRYDHLVCPTCLARSPKLTNTCHPKTKYLLAAATSYNEPVIQKIIRQFKYEGWQSLVEPLGDFLLHPLQKILRISDILSINLGEWLITPLPLHSKKQRERGFNQAELLAHYISNKTGVLLLKDNLVRVRNTLSQAELPDWQARENNVRDAFLVNNPEKIRGKNIILVDDVFTSGATLNEAVRVLKTTKAKKIIALVVARAR